MVAKDYENLQEEVQDMRKLTKKFRIMYKDAIQEIKDLNNEHTSEKQELWDTIGDFQKEIALYKAVMREWIQEGEMQKVAMKSSFDEDNKTWQLPFFKVEGRRVNFSKMGAKYGFKEDETATHGGGDSVLGQSRKAPNAVLDSGKRFSL